LSLWRLEVDHKARRIGKSEGAQACRFAQADAPRQVALEVFDNLGLHQHGVFRMADVSWAVVSARRRRGVDLYQEAGSAVQGDRLTARSVSKCRLCLPFDCVG